MLARNRLLALLAASAASLESFNSCCARFHSVMSRITLDAPITCPVEFLIGDIVMEPSSCRPSQAWLVSQSSRDWIEAALRRI
jgi:hypothetical protein